MLILDVNKLSKDFGFDQLFKDVSFTLNEGETISIVGPNGCGKSTLLRMIAGLEKIDSGSVNIKKGAKVAYLDQTGSSFDDDRRVYEILKDAFKDLNSIEERIGLLQSFLDNNTYGDNYDVILEKYCKLVEKFSQLGGYDIKTNINIVTEGLKFTNSMLEQSYNKLSGGEKTLVQLAKALLIKPDLFLLDEPTNHLDIERIEWLENYIKSFKGAMVIVSHDRYFLDKISNKILSLDFGSAKVYSTNYTNYLKEKERDFEKQLANYKDQQLEMQRIEKQIKYFAEIGMAKNSSTMCDRAHALQTQLDRMKKNAIEKPRQLKKINIQFDEEKKSSKKIIETINLKTILPNRTILLNNINLKICLGERIALIGNNGSGKSTFVKALIGLNELPYEGEVIVGPSVKIGYLPQIIKFVDEEESLLDSFKDSANLEEQRARQILAEFNFYKDDVNKKVKNLSGGEKIRVKLAELLQQKINTLIFDEPTNHIDIPSKEALENAIEKFGGTLIFVSHDRYFINKFANKTIEFKNGKIETYLGGYDYYKNEKQKRLK